MAGVLIRRGKFRHRQKRRECHVMMEVEIGIMMPQAKEYLPLPETGRSKGGSFPRAFRGNTALPTA